MQGKGGDDSICVNAIVSGQTVSEITSGNEKYPEKYPEMVVSGRCSKRDEIPKDLSGAIVFLASDNSDFVTGQPKVIDGRMIMY